MVSGPSGKPPAWQGVYFYQGKKVGIPNKKSPSLSANELLSGIVPQLSDFVKAFDPLSRVEIPETEEQRFTEKASILAGLSALDYMIAGLMRKPPDQNLNSDDFFADEIIPILDAFYMAEKEAKTRFQATFENSIQGRLLSARRKLRLGMDKFGFEEVDVRAGDPFDPKIHHGVATAGAKSEIAKNIKSVNGKTYYYNDEVLRAAPVEVF